MRLPPDEWRGTKRNQSIKETLAGKVKLLHARGRSVTQIADRLGITEGRARNILNEIRLGRW